MTGQPDRRAADVSDTPDVPAPEAAAPDDTETRETHETRDDLETTMTTEQPDETGTDVNRDMSTAAGADASAGPTTDATSDPTTDPAAGTGSRTSGDRPDPTLSASLGWPDATTPLPQASTPDTTALPVAHTTALPHAQTATLPQASGPVGSAPQAAASAGAPFRVEPSAPVPDDVVPASDPTRLPPPAWPPVAEPVAQTYGGPQGPGVTVRRGPRPGTVMFGLLAMIVAAYVLVANLTNADLSIRLVGPPLIGAFGGMLLLVGIAGVLAGRLRR